MEIKLTIPDDVVNNEPDAQRYFEMLQLMVNRKAMGYYRYGVLSDKFPDSMTGFDNALTRLNAYEANHNTENCIDAANFCLFEAMFPKHEDAYFKAQQQNESPKVVWKEN